MTLCKYRPQRTYDAQYILEQNDVNGMMKHLREKTEELGEDGDIAALYYLGAVFAFTVIFTDSRNNGEVDKWTDFAEGFKQLIDETEGGL